MDDPRHIGVIDDVNMITRVARVIWDDTMWVSVLPLHRLQRRETSDE